ncbi:MAG: hypothetical protein OXK74_09030 [Gemmatimonadota bacterium]|nr:hypothetical protein [Gemmatimonadota bacterium]
MSPLEHGPEALHAERSELSGEIAGGNEDRGRWREALGGGGELGRRCG